MSERRLLLASAAAALALFALVAAIPYFARSRQVVVAVPQPAPLFSEALVGVGPGQQACADQVGLPPGDLRAQTRVGTYGRPGPSLTVTATAPGYATRAVIPAGYVDNAFVVSTPFRGPSRAALGVVCLANSGTSAIALYGAADRTHSRSVTRVAGAVQGPNFELALLAAHHQTLALRLPEVMERVGLFRPRVGGWIEWPLAVLFVFGVPALTLLAVRRAER